jgi:hypothetical protein
MPLFDGEHLLGTPDDRPALETVRFNEEAPSREAGLQKPILANCYLQTIAMSASASFLVT